MLLLRPKFSLLSVLLLLCLGIFGAVFAVKGPAESIPVVTLAPENPKNYSYSKPYEFSSDWFTQHTDVWQKVLAPYKGKPNLHYLEVGVFEGRAAFWMLENILTDPSASLTVMDLFGGDYNANYPEFAKNFFSNLELSGEKHRVEVIKGFSQIELRKLPLNHFDIIYIDGSHTNPDVLEDAMLCRRMLKTGGTLIFDDYGRRQPEYTGPKGGIRTFFAYWGNEFEVLHNDHPIHLRKKASSEGSQEH
jgi:SAM-dependent methyltransferase